MEQQQQQQREVCVTRETLAAVESGAIWREVLREEPDMYKVSFEVAHLLLFHPQCFFHPILTTCVPKESGARLLFLFPATLNRPVIDTGKTPLLTDISASINAHLVDTDPRNTQIILCMGRARYRIQGIPAGAKVYLQWASTLNIYRQKVPTHWEHVPILAATDGHFGQWAAIPFFGMGDDRSFIDVRRPPRIKSVLPPGGFVQWYLDTPLDPGVQPKASHVLNARRVQHLAERDTVPDHELSLYDARPTLAVVSRFGADLPGDFRMLPLETHDIIDPDRSVEGITSTDDDTSGILVFHSDFPTPRDPYALQQKEDDEVMDEFFAGHQVSAPTRIPVDFDVTSESLKTHQSGTKAPPPSPASAEQVVFAAPQDSKSRRTARRAMQPSSKSE